MSLERERLYHLLPAYLRYRDWYEGQPLRALMAALETQYRALDEDVRQLYDDWFVETCQERIAPYLAELLGVDDLNAESWVPGQRTRVANTLVYRQLKGTPAMLSKVARDVTGWPCRAVPGVETLAATQCLQSPRPDAGRTVDLRRTGELARLDGPFDRVAHRVQVSGSSRELPQRRPRAGHAPDAVALHFWRLQSYPVAGRTARVVRSPGCLTFHPLGIDQPLFAAARAPGEISEPVEAAHVPGPITRRALAEEIEARRAGRTPATGFLGPRPAFEIVDPHTGRPLHWRDIAVGDLSAWRRTVDGRPLAPSVAGGRSPATPPRVLVDPELGRLAFLADEASGGAVEVSYRYGLGADLGGGPYERPDVLDPDEDGDRKGPDREAYRRAEDEAGRYPALEDALGRKPPDAGHAILTVTDSATYGGWRGIDLPLRLGEGECLTIRAAPGAAPCFIGDLLVEAEGSSAATRLTLDGLIVGGRIRVRGALTLEIRHCTVHAPPTGVAGGGGVESVLEFLGEPSPDKPASDVVVHVESSLVGPLRLPAGIGALRVVDSVVDASGGLAVAADERGAPGPALEASRCTFFGVVAVSRVAYAEDVLFDAALVVTDTESGLLSHCFVPRGSVTPARRRCQPDRALETADPAARGALAARLAPTFTSRRLGDAGYAQLGPRCPREIRTGASNGAEIGVFQPLRNAQREANLQGILDEFLPWGLEARVFYVT